MRQRQLFWLWLVLALLGGGFLLWRNSNRLTDQLQADAIISPAQATSPVPVFSVPYAPLNASAPVASGVTKGGAIDPVLRNTGLSLDRLVRREHALVLVNAWIDTEGPVALGIPESLRAEPGHGTYIVQAKGKVDEPFRALLRAAGAEVVSYIPNNAELVRVSEAGAGRLSSSALVQRVLAWEPYFKLDPGLLDLALTGQDVPGDVTLGLGVYADARAAVLAGLQQLGAEVAGEDKTPFGWLVRVHAAKGTFVAMSRLPGVMSLEPIRERVYGNDLMRQRLGVSVNTTVGSNYLNLTGSNVVVSVVDSGVDGTHPDLTGRVSGSTTDNNGHGTHVVGTIIGNGSQSATVSNASGSVIPGASFRGMASNASAYVIGIGVGTGPRAGGGSPGSDGSLQEQAANGTNRLLVNNSWNYAGATGYDLAAASYDAAVRDALPGVTGSQPLLYVFSAGNGGGGNEGGSGGNAGTVYSPGTAKNVITVGAVEQRRNITNQVIQGTFTNQAFKAGTDTSNQVAGYSGRGNVGVSIEGAAGRFKPDVAAPGTFVVSTRSATWDQGAYYNPTNFTVNRQRNRTVDAGALEPFSILVPENAVQVVITVLSNNLSLSPFPNMPLYVGLNDVPTATQFDFKGTNTVSLPPDLALNPGAILYYSVGNGTNRLISFDVETLLVTTNDNGNYLTVLSNLNDGLGPNYRYESGTSMAAAGVTGTLVLLEEFFEQRLQRTNSPALLKALLINGSRPVAPQYTFGQVPGGLNYQGWGLPVLSNSIPAVLTNTAATNLPVQYVDQGVSNAVATGQSRTRTVTLAGSAVSQSLRVTLVWTDPPGNPAAGTKLVNDLDLIVTNLDTGDVFWGNDFPAGSVFTSSAGTNGVERNDVVNNVENVYLQTAGGTNFTVTVLGRRVNVNAVDGNTNGVVQDYALVVASGDGSATAGAFTMTDAPTPPNRGPVVGSLTSGVPLLGQRVGANSQYAPTTNGVSNQWNFYVFTNTQAASNSAFTNVAFVTFSPPTLGLPRMGVRVADPANASRVEADVDLYVSTNPNLTNLNPAVLAAADKSLTRTGTEKVLYTNSTAGQVYYIGVKSEDRQGAEYGFLGVATDQPFSQQDANGNVILTVLTPPFPAAIPPGTPAKPGSVTVLALTTSSAQARKVVVRDTVTHQEFGDLVGAFSHGTKHVVLNNHSFFSNPNFTTETFIYDDTQEGDFPGARKTDGPGSLTDFMGDKASEGLWMLSMVNDSSPNDLGTIDSLQALVVPQPPTNGMSGTVGENSWVYGFVDVPREATNLTVTVQITGSNAAPLELFLRRGSIPDPTHYDKRALISPPGGTLTLSIYESPPLNAGRYFMGLFNPNATPQSFNIFWTLGYSLVPEPPLKVVSAGNEPILDDAVTTSTNHVGIASTVVSAEVGVRIDHPRESDLALTLISPRGTRVLLAENRGGLDTNGYGSGVNITNVPITAHSGNASANTNDINVGLNTGTVIINYQFYDVPDQLRIYYDGARIFDTGLINGSGSFSVDFGPGLSTDVVILMNEGGNPNSNTLWDYTATVVTRAMVYATFTDDTNKTTLPIKFAPPPFTVTTGPSTVTISDFEVSMSNYPAGSTVDGWSVLTNQVTVTNTLANTGSQSLNLRNGNITRTLPAVGTGSSGLLSYAYRRSPALDPVSWWAGENNTLDVMGQNNGTAVGVSYSAGKVNTAFNINSVKYVSVPDNANLTPASSFTVDAWVFPTGPLDPIASPIVKKAGIGFNQQTASGQSTGYSLEFAGTNGVLLAVYLPGGWFFSPPTPVPLNAWSHVAGVYNGSTISLYVNGALAASAPGAGPITPSTNPLLIGHDFANAIRFYNGLIDEPAIYDVALTAVQIQDIYLAGSLGRCGMLTPPSACPPSQAMVLLNGSPVQNITGGSNWATGAVTLPAGTNSPQLRINYSNSPSGLLLDSFSLQQSTSTAYYLPEEPLSKLVGESSLGDWKLEVWDNRVGASNPTPQLVSWQLSLVLDRVLPATIPLSHAIPNTNTVAANSIAYYLVDVPAWARFATNILVSASAPVDVIFNQNQLPGTNAATDVTFLTAQTTGTRTLATTGPPPLLQPGNRYYLGVRNQSAAPINFVIEVDFDITTLTNAITLTNTLTATTLPRYYQYDVSSNAVVVAFEILQPNGNVDLVARRGPPLPDELSFDYQSSNPGTNNEAIVVATNSTPVALTPGRWYLGVFNHATNNVTYGIRATEYGPPTIIDLTNGVPFNYSSAPGPAVTNFFRFVIDQTNSAALFELYGLNGDVDLTLQRGKLPYNAPFFALSANAGMAGEQIVIRTNLLGTDINGDWFLGVPNNALSNVSYTIRAVVATNGILESGVPPEPVVVVPPGGGGTNGPTLSWPSVDGELYEVQESTDLVTWVTVATITGTGGVVSWTDPVPIAGQPARYYRIIQIPVP